MAPADEIALIGAGVYFWQAYAPAVKADLCSSALATPKGLFLVDPIALKPESLAEITVGQKIAGVVVTNENHERAALQYAQEFGVPVFADPAVPEAGTWPRLQSLSTAGLDCPGLAAISLPGAPAGETALHYSENGGTLIIGDALINLEPYGFVPLPAKYCADDQLMHESLKQLLDYRLERILFAHGTPIVAKAHSRLEQLLASGS
jgi:glyoxylase-like metal-dependent hydrolase (beta-lactamase superfamily II)